MFETEIEFMNLKQIADSGQCFRWKEIADNKYAIAALDRCLEVEQKGQKFTFSCTSQEWEALWKNYFDLETDYGRIGRLIADSGDLHLQKAYSYGSGMRILRQDLWEIIVSFMISQNNNIKRIKGSIERLCQEANLENLAFPKPGQIDPELFMEKDLGLGYRNVYLHDIYQFAQNNPKWLENLKKLSYDEAMETLMKQKGIGKKVANCICLFGLHFVDAFPIDTHVRQLLEEHYKEGFDFEKYQGVAGIIQQYLFYYELIKKQL